MQHLVELLQELWSGGGIEAATRLYTDEAVRADPTVTVPARGPQQIATYIAGVHAAFPDFKLEIQQSISEGDKWVTQWRTSGTHLGEFLGIPPSGKWVEVTGVAIGRIENGKVAEEQAYFDRLSLLQQLGIVPAEPQSNDAKAAGQ